MNPEKQRIAIAEKCGWRFVPEHDRMSPGGHEQISYPESWINPDGEDDVLPDYLNDLNAMHDAEKVLDEKQQVWYLQKLSQIRLRQGISGTIARVIDKTTFATATQRAEAFLRATGLWTEDKP